MEVFPGAEVREYGIAGPVHYILNRIPTTGEHMDLEELRYEVADMVGKTYSFRSPKLTIIEDPVLSR